MDEKELLHIKLLAFKDSLHEELQELSGGNREEVKRLQDRLKELNDETNRIREQVKRAKSMTKENKDKILFIGRKIKAINQLL